MNLCTSLLETVLEFIKLLCACRLVFFFQHTSINLQKTTQLNFLLTCILIETVSPDHRLEFQCARTVQTQSEHVNSELFGTEINS